MKIIELESDILVYQFTPDIKNSAIGLNIFVVVNNNECIVIETGYKEFLLEVLEDLKNRGISVSKVIQTHFHPDHIGGLPLIKGVEIIGSIYAQSTLKTYTKDFVQYFPTVVVVDHKTFKFGRHTFNLELNKGHSIDGLLITLNNKYMFVGDDIILDNNGNASIPFCSLGDTQAHINSLNKILSKVSDKTILPTHGSPLVGKDIIITDLINRLTYLHFIKENTKASYEDFHNETNISFVGRDWHVLKKIEEVE